MPRILKLSLFVSVLCPLAVVHAQTTTVVVLEGDVAPDGNGTFSYFTTPALNDVGQAAFFARLTGTSGGSSDDRGLFRGDGVNSLTQIAREGQAAPDGNGTFSDFPKLKSPALNNGGQAAFSAVLTGTSGGSSDDRGIFLGDGVIGPTLIARAGQAAPDGNGTFLFFSDTPSLNDAGQAAFRANLTNASDELLGGIGFFRGDGVTGPTRIVRAGQAAPDGNGTFSGINPAAGPQFRPALNDAGQAAFIARLTGTSSGFSDNRGIFRGDGVTSLTQIAGTGQAAPDGNGRFCDFENPALNNAGQAGMALTSRKSSRTNDEALLR